MADIMAKTIKFPGLNNTYEFMQPDGTYPDLTAGNIISNDAYNEDTEPYLFRALPYKSKRLAEDIVGGTVRWNQLVKNGNFADGTTNWSRYNTSVGTISASGGVLTHTITGGTTYYAYYYGIGQNGVVKNPTHKFLICATVKPSIATTFTFDFGGGRKYTTGTLTANQKTVVAAITDAFSVNEYFYMYPVSAVNNVTAPAMTMEYSNVQAIDLTATFGSTIADYVYSLEQATAGSGIAWLKSYGFFTEPYYEYDAGTLKSVNPTAHVTRGVNAWDEEWELGTYLNTTGAKYPSSTKIRNKNPISVLPNTAYFWHVGSTSADEDRIWYYDSEMNLIGSVYINHQTTVSLGFTTPNNCAYINFSIYNTTYKNDICINISDPTINGKYFPYEEHTYDLGNVPLYGLFQLVNNKLKAYGDVRHADDGTDRKFALVDLGTLNWTYNASYGFISTDLVGKSAWQGICSKYEYGGGYNYLTDKQIGFIYFTAVVVRDSAFTDPTAFKSAMSGVMLCYEKATTTTEDTPSFEKIQSCFPYGTEEYITTNGVPVGHDTKYYTDVISNIASIPEPPSGNGIYELKLTVTDGVASYSWVAV